MKQKYTLVKLLVLAIIVAGLNASLSNIFAQELPAPTIYYTFDNDADGYVTQIYDSSGNDYHGYWDNYWDGNQTMYAGFYPDSGLVRGAWYMSGYHVCCENMCSSSQDFIILSGNQNANDPEGYQEEHPVFHTGVGSFSVAFWFKSDRDYAGSDKPCPPDPVDMHEQEILFSFGRRNAFAIQNYKGYFSVKIGKKDEGADAEITEIRSSVNESTGVIVKDWLHVAATYDSTSGTLSFYLDGELAKSAYGDPNPVQTGFTAINPDNSSAEIGAQNAGGLFGDPGDGYWGNPTEQCCVTADDKGKYRTGWPAAGYFDNFRFYNGNVLSQEQVQQMITNDKSGGGNGNGNGNGNGGTNSLSNSEIKRHHIYPNPTTGSIFITGLKNTTTITIYNSIGKRVLAREVSPSGQLDIGSLQKGIYFVKIGNNSFQKIVLR